MIIPRIGDHVVLPYLLGFKNRTVLTTEIGSIPSPHAGIPGSPLVFFAKGFHKQSRRTIDFFVMADDGSCSM